MGVADIILYPNAASPNDVVLRSGLLSAAYPILLMPVRIETKFFWTPDPQELRIRVYPDEIFADPHEPLLTLDEQTAGITYWTDGWLPENEQAAWRELVKHRTPERAAWIARVMTPSNADVAVTPPPAWMKGGFRVGTRPDHRPATPIFPTVPVRPSLWTRAAQTGTLPDCFSVIAFRGGIEVGRVQGATIPPVLNLAFRSDVSVGELANIDGLRVEPELRWTVDFAEAERVGMALRLPIHQIDYDNGFDQLVVVGLKTGVTPTDAAARLAGAFDAHHYSRGLAFVRQGTPTNNSDAARSGYPPPDDPDWSFGIERSGALPTSGTDGANLVAALGLSPTTTGTIQGVFDHIEGTARREGQSATWMNQALWPCTLGYFLDQMMYPVLADTDIADARAHFEGYVKARGPLPALRISGVPYGILPATSVGSWVPRVGAGKFETKLPQLLLVWRALWLARAYLAPHTGKNPTQPDQELLEILGLDASAHEVRVRELVGPGFVDAIFRIVGLDPTLDDNERATLISINLTNAGLGGLHPRLEGMTFADTALRTSLPLVTSDPLSEDLVLSMPFVGNYIAKIAEWSTGGPGSIDGLQDAVLIGQPARVYPLLYHLLRQAALVEYNRVGTQVAIARQGNVTQPVDAREAELFHIPDDSLQAGIQTRATCWERFAFSTIPGITPLTLKAWLLADTAATDERASIAAFRNALVNLASLPTAELDRLVTETLDACSHRLDAWITSLATRRLAELRTAQPTGIHLGAFGFVLNLRPQPASSATPGGYIHAPSMAHAATAAVLRNAHLTQTGSVRDQVTIDLSSARVRKALHLLEGVEAGQPLGVLLGYRFERLLHEALLDQYIEPFRRAYPIGSDPTAPPAGLTEKTSARTVVNGLALRTAGVAGVPWGTNGLPVSSPPSATYTSIVPLINALEDDVDAAADLLTAESVHQAIQGNPARAGSTLAALAGGATIPKPHVIEAPRSGSTYTHRLGVWLGDHSTIPLAHWPSDNYPGAIPQPRRAAEPRLDRWVGQLLGDPANTFCAASYVDPSRGDRSRGALDRRPPGPRRGVIDATHRTSVIVSLADLGLVPLEVLELARRSGSDGNPEIISRIEWRLRHDLGLDAQGLIVDFAPASIDATVSRTLRDVLDTARTIAELVGDARTLTSRDLLRPGETSQATSIVQSDLDSRAGAAQDAFEAMLAALNAAVLAVQVSHAPYSLDPLRTQLFAACLFDLPSAIPANQTGTDAVAMTALVTQANSVLATMATRLAAMPDLDVIANQTYENDLAVLAAVFGASFKALPLFQPGNRTDLDLAFAQSDVLTGGSVEPLRWMHRTARVRSAVSRFRLVAMTTETIGLGAAPFDLSVGQLPYEPAGRWIGLPFLTGQRPPSGYLSIAARRVLDTSALNVAGLLIDDWSEFVPSDTQKTAFAIHYDNPGAEAPQVALLAVPAGPQTNWDQASVVAIIRESIDLAQIRAVDADVLGQSLLAPTIYIAANVADSPSNNVAVADDLGTLVMAEDIILP